MTPEAVRKGGLRRWAQASTFGSENPKVSGSVPVAPCWGGAQKQGRFMRTRGSLGDLGFVPISYQSFCRDQNLPPPATPGKGPLRVAGAAKYPTGVRASSDRIKLAFGSDDGAVGASRTRDQVARTR